MIELTDQQKSQYLYRSYTAVDGLWFMKVEDKCGFDSALTIDDEVWKVLPKIQARWLKAVANMGEGTEALFECITTKLSMDGYIFTTEKDTSGFRVIIKHCPWLHLLVKSGRADLAEKLLTRICVTEFSAWASEFGNKIHFLLGKQICQGDDSCLFQFTDNNDDTRNP